MVAFKQVVLTTTLSVIAATGFASEHIIVAPKCLLEKSNFNYHRLAQSNSLSLIKTNQKSLATLIDTRDAQHTLCGNFIDVTRAWKNRQDVSTSARSFLHYYEAPATTRAAAESNYKLQYSKQVNQLFNQINPQTMWNTLSDLSSFPDRYALSNNGVKAAAWFKDGIEKIAKETNHTNDVLAYYIPTGGNYKQPSVVVKFGHLHDKTPGIVIGAHMDTLAASSWGNKPGADDDGSGSVVVLEAARTLMASGMQFKKPIYFVWYAAEELGLVGSDVVVNHFKRTNIPVDAVIHFDMTGYAYRNDPTIWVMDDYTNKSLTNFMTQLISTYVKQPVKHSRCGYACSDHANWHMAGYPAVIPAEAAYENTNPSMHSSRDTMDNLSLDHMTNYAKLAVAAAVELAEPTNN